MAIILLLLIAALIGADQLVKYWAIHSLAPVRTMEFIHFGSVKVLDLTYLENDGAIFGSMSGQRWFLIGFTSLVIIAGVIALFFAAKRSKFLGASIALFVAGGIGNLIDRIRFGYVVDMFEVKLFHFAIFNVADICVTVAFAMILIYIIFIDPKIEKAKKAAAEKEGENA
ncbi:MAG: signal peptidase II [Ruminococcus sp.]|nr:signal peptidase II [Ruminococcus sp.]